ncbi:prenyltransferase/squalene oxidase repeat-containing protein [Pedobacter arcticus]|uniref:hypothetical protein n=1 Tax=Pedobacter arcticus TaxID=752140 RepID=UPI0002E7BA2D|nr:hypothetical protein [Pedobacter arcticus]
MLQAADEYPLLGAAKDFFCTLPETIVSAPQLDLLKKAAAFFPPIIRFALECRLNKQDQVDLQFCIRRDEDDLASILSWFERKLSGNGEDQLLLSFLKEWADKNSFYHKSIPEIFLELDVNSPNLNVPLLFFELETSLTSTQRKDYSLFILNNTLGKNKPYYKLLETIIEACPDPAYLAYLGILFSRNNDVLRVNIKKLPYCSVVPFLQKTGYKWLSKELEYWLSLIYTYADRITLCIDIGSEIYPKIGFECFWNGQPSTETYWKDFIEKLKLDSILEKDKIKTILEWNEDVFPGKIENWPSHLWLDSLGKSESEFTYLKKWISHLKLSYQPENEIEIKAYLAYESLWMSQNTINLDSLQKQENQIYDEPQELEKVIDKGIDFLLSNQTQAGWWKDFHLEPGTSDEWVTAYVAYYLSNLKTQKTQKSLEKAWDILKTRYRMNEGWGYNALTRGDADSTTWVLHFTNSENLIGNLDICFLSIVEKHISEDGGIVTYAKRRSLEKEALVATSVLFNGWQIPHNCVTAAYALTGKQHAIDYLINQQDKDGFWYGYWWDGYEYATGLATEALYSKNAEKYKKSIESAINWATHEANRILNASFPNTFKLAFLLRILLCDNSEKENSILKQKITTVLINSQEQQGCWKSDAILRSPNSNDRNHENGKNIPVFKDQMKNFTTVTVLDALNKYALSLIK